MNHGTPWDRIAVACDEFLRAHRAGTANERAAALRELQTALGIDYVPLSIRDNPAAVAAWSQGANYYEPRRRPRTGEYVDPQPESVPE